MVEEIILKEKSKELEKKFNLNHYELLQRYMFEKILERISVSKYQNNFILKGGLLLSAIFGVNNRTTKDIDTIIKGINVDKIQIVNILNEILSIDLKDKVKFDIVDVADIREENEYGGNKYHIIARLGNTTVNIEIDISTGDIITPKELKFKYPLMFSKGNIMINSYNLETIFAEKLETILRRGKYNSRMKDYYDVYYFLTKIKNEINIEILKKAINNTFIKRESIEYLNDYTKIIDSISEDQNIRNLWDIYKAKNKYAKNINYFEILIILKKFLKELKLEIKDGEL